MKKVLLGMVVLALATASVRSQHNACVAYSATNCAAAPSITFAPVSPISVSVCDTVSASTTAITNGSHVVVTSVAETCARTETTIATNYPTVVSNWTAVFWNSQTTTNSGLSASFIPGNAGSGTIAFYSKYTVPWPCAGTSTALLNVSVTVTDCPPSITLQPASQTVAACDPVTFLVSACGSAPLSYQWSLGGANIAGATGSAYSLPAVGSNDAGSYTVAISNTKGCATSATAVLTVAPGEWGPDSNGNGVPDWLETAMGYDPRQANDLGKSKPGFILFLAQPRAGSQLP